MGRTLAQVMRSLPIEHRIAVEERAAVLIAQERARCDEREKEGAAGRDHQLPASAERPTKG